MSGGSAPRPQVAVGGVIWDRCPDTGERRVLLVQRGQPPSAGKWTVPGGRVEPGERLSDALRRELREETGLEVAPGALVEVVEIIVPAGEDDGEDDGDGDGGDGSSDDGFHYVILDYLAELRGGALAPASDVRDARWCTAAEMAALPLTGQLERVLDKAWAMLDADAGAEAGPGDGAAR